MTDGAAASTYRALIMRQAASGLSLSAGSLPRWARNSGWRDRRPVSVRAYSLATVASSTPHSARTRAQRTPVRSLPAVQCSKIGAGGDGDARCARIVR